MYRTRTLTATLLAASSFAAIQVAEAQETEPEAETQDRYTLENVVVTARRVEENLQDTPIAVSAFTARGLEARQIDTTDQLVQATPNLQFNTQSPASGNNASSQIFIRGIGQTDFLASTDPGVGMYIDGVYLARSVGAAMDFFDVERVEVLKGPQGTLFGRNTIGGAINIVSKKPADEFGGRAYAKIGSDNRVDLFGTLDVPLSDTTAAKVTLGSRDRDGYVTRLQTGEQVGDDNKFNGRVQLRFEPTDTFEANFTADFTDQDEVGPPLVFGRLNPNQAFFNIAGGTAACSAFGPPGNRPASCTSDEFDAGPFANNGTFLVESTFNLVAYNLTLDWAVGDIDIKSITAFRETEWTGSRDADNTPLTILHTALDEEQEQFSQEVQFSGMGLENKLQWLFGLYYFDETADNDYLVETAPGTFILDGLYENSTAAAFANLTFDLTDRLHLTGGLRVFDEKKKFTPDQRTTTNYVVPFAVACSPASALQDPGNPLFNPVCQSATPPPVIVFGPGTPLLPLGEVERSFSGTTPVVSLSYDFSEDILGYVSYTEGFKSGGFNGRQIFPLTVVPEFGEETATSIEVGLKTTLLNNTLRLNGAAYSTKYDDIQIVVRQNFAPININAGEATIQGFELEAEYVPTPNLIIQGAVGFTDTSYDEISAIAQANNVLLSNRLPFAPEWSANLGGAYTFDLPGGATLTPRVDWSYQDDKFFDSVNTPSLSQDAFSLINASITFASPDDTWRLRLAGTNLGDEVYRIAGFTSFGNAAAYEETAFARGSEWSLTLERTF